MIFHVQRRNYIIFYNAISRNYLSIREKWIEYFSIRVKYHAQFAFDGTANKGTWTATTFQVPLTYYWIWHRTHRPGLPYGVSLRLFLDNAEISWFAISYNHVYIWDIWLTFNESSQKQATLIFRVLKHLHFCQFGRVSK